MWNLSMNDVLAAKEELTGRRAAIKARYEKDLQAIEDDLKNILALESAANLFLKTHKQEEAEAGVEHDPVFSEESGSTAPAFAAEIMTEPEREQQIAELEVIAAESADAKSADLSLERKVNRWRIR